jgi:ABC-type branched-subunit amino acid transport system ATPase component
LPTILVVDQMAIQALAAADRSYVVEPGHIVRAGSAAARDCIAIGITDV